jgi:hypothetical protein
MMDVYHIEGRKLGTTTLEVDWVCLFYMKQLVYPIQPNLDDPHGKRTILIGDEGPPPELLPGWKPEHE